ncbi:MAG: hypothetical protein CL858_10745 [Cupriavidus sp.]|jgi:hypothetical protein|uniref:hypothetical protein n=1 Tax=Cupriavidus pauculus TaxID=82633 RepID=UPI000785E9D9|nr:hypothetical protein [Cupriavidus pauculus]MBU65916.1 hypothetical protein [Cupriavidus sp.]KAB0603513.1 hypothetical protein F7R19_08415 [Cupriavidus pauculus]MBY4731973.1 hypothetical protein [Cupriavidus pauculus]MCM3605761.1 hypothetical protein [Cupriavidus pauculus]UAL02277.1 hypothetical protein K8O84_26210 [Cupriavidus pauculus]
MDRQTKHKAELRAMIRAEQDKLDVCKGTCFGDICWTAPDAQGCNWRVSKMEGENGNACLDALRPVLETLRQQFNIPDEEARG